MMGDTSIQWTDKTWNPVRGCSRVSEGCRCCYAERQAARFSKPGEPFHYFVRISNGHPQWTGKVELIEKHLEDPMHWRKPCRVFVNSMSDLFHEALPDQAIDRVFAVMALCPQHTFQILTKRPARMNAYLKSDMNQMSARMAEDVLLQKLVGAATMGHSWPLPNVWLGVSVEDQATADERIPLLLQTPAAVRFVSYEPALGPVDFQSFFPLDYQRGATALPPSPDWIIVGGESGPGARPADIQWFRNVIAQCKAAGVPCFFKQAGSNATLENTRMRLHDAKGGDLSELPRFLNVREFPRQHPAKLTFEAAERLRKQVTVDEIPNLEILALSGKTSNVDGNLTGTKLFGAIQRGGRWAPRAWVWKVRGAASVQQCKELRDIAGLAEGDPVTWGHIDFLGGRPTGLNSCPSPATDPATAHQLADERQPDGGQTAESIENAH